MLWFCTRNPVKQGTTLNILQKNWKIVQCAIRTISYLKEKKKRKEKERARKKNKKTMARSIGDQLQAQGRRTIFVSRLFFVKVNYY